MPRRYKARTPYRKRSGSGRQRSARTAGYSRNRRYRARRKRTFSMYRNPLTRTRFCTKLRYATQLVLDPKPDALGLTGSNVWQYSANGLFDPDLTGFGHQPMYFDNYTQLYQRYKVKKARMNVTVVNDKVNTATANAGVVTLQPNYSYKLFILADATFGLTNEYPANMNEVIEENGPNISWRFVAPSLTGRLPKLSKTITPHRLANLSSGEQNLSALYTTNPASQAYFYVGITSADGTSDPPNVSLYVTIDYVVEFYDRQPIQPVN